VANFLTVCIGSAGFRLCTTVCFTNIFDKEAFQLKFKCGQVPSFRRDRETCSPQLLDKGAQNIFYLPQYFVIKSNAFVLVVTVVILLL